MPDVSDHPTTTRPAGRAADLPALPDSDPIEWGGTPRFVRLSGFRSHGGLLALALIAAAAAVLIQLWWPLPTPESVRAPAAVPSAPVPTALPAGASAGDSGEFGYVSGYGPVLGHAGPIRRFRVAIEQPAGAPAEFAHQVDRTLGDPRSWVASRQFRLQRVPEAANAEFTILLASARTSELMCLSGGLRTNGYTSCRLPGRVIINDSRWAAAVPGYGAPLAVYRAYAINHEVGHQLGHGHERCPAKGDPAPVMMQQTFGLQGCVANSWPYLAGKRWSGPPAA